MRILIRIVLGMGLLSALALLAWLAIRPSPLPPTRAMVIGLPAEGSITSPRFTRAFEPRAFHFPLDHGPHPDFQTEWWYYTGNLRDQNGRPFGYQLTFFRRALATPSQAPTRSSDLATSQIYFAHFGMTDIDAGKHVSFERFSRGAGGLAGASGVPYEVHLEDWSASSLDVDGTAVRLRARHGTYQVALDLKSVKPATLQGNQGLSPKSDQPGNASYYYSFTRLETTGQIQTDSGVYDVTGTSWMDHEWSTSALGASAQGWDWFALQLDDRREIMFYQFRNRDGTTDPISSGVLVEADGGVTGLRREDVNIDVLERWRSPASSAEYPIRWRLAIPAHSIDLTIEARLRDQEMDLSVIYWEGAVNVTGQVNGTALNGVGYVELTGYSGTLNGKF